MNEPIVVINHVSMMFNIASEQLNSLKEYFLALVKGQLHFKEFMALNDIDFVVNRGDRYGIVGTNGSGKSTMLKIIAGVLEPTRGRVAIGGTIAPLIELGAGFDMELTTLNQMYLEDRSLNVVTLGRGFAWLDTGTMESLFEASEFVRVVERSQGMPVSVLEEIAFENGWIGREEMLAAAERFGKSEYGVHLRKVAEGKIVPRKERE